MTTDSRKATQDTLLISLNIACMLLQRAGIHSSHFKLMRESTAPKQSNKTTKTADEDITGTLRYEDGTV